MREVKYDTTAMAQKCPTPSTEATVRLASWVDVGPNGLDGISVIPTVIGTYMPIDEVAEFPGEFV